MAKAKSKFTRVLAIDGGGIRGIIPGQILVTLEEKLKKKFKQLEDKLQEINKTKSLLENKLANPEVYGNKDSFLEVETAYKKASMEADQINAEYEKLFEEIMVLESGT